MRGKKVKRLNSHFSLVVQKRRERINERLRILQNLVPNGTKVKTKKPCKRFKHADDMIPYMQFYFIKNGS